MSEIIPKEKLIGFQRWQISSFDQPKPAPAPLPQRATEPRLPQAAESPPALRLPTIEDIERIHEEAHRAGYQEGYEEGIRAGEQSSRETASAEMERFRKLTEGMQKALDELDQQVAEQLLALSIEIAAQVIRSNISVKSDLLLPVIREAISALPLQHTQLNLRLNPGDAALIRPLLGEQLAQSGAQIIEDGEISPGGCMVRAGSSEVDASIETRWKRVIEALGAEPTTWLNT